MNHRSTLAGVLSAGLLSTASFATLAPTAQAAPDPDPGHDVSIVVSDQEPELDDKITVKGLVDDARRGGLVQLQVKYADRTGWKSIGHDRLSARGTYKIKERVTSLRERKYRVVALATAQHRREVSGKETVTVYGWRNLIASPPVAAKGLSLAPSVAINGVTYPSSVVETTVPGSAPPATMDFNLNRDCKAMRGTAGLSDSSAVGGTASVALVADGSQRFAGTYGLTQSAPYALDLTGVFRLTLTSTSTGGGLGAFGSPQVLCSF